MLNGGGFALRGGLERVDGLGFDEFAEVVVGDFGGLAGARKAATRWSIGGRGASSSFSASLIGDSSDKNLEISESVVQGMM